MYALNFDAELAWAFIGIDLNIDISIETDWFVVL
jgi:hypothetical protein